MGFRTWCDNKGCRKEMEPVLDKHSGEVICTECNKPINTMTEFAKRQMVSLGQVRRSEQKKQAWSVKCDKCQREGPPKLNKAGEKDKNNQQVINLHCTYCEGELTNLNRPFADMIKQNLLAQRRAGQ